jgi:iron complex transport system substrate-binding protein
VRRALLLFLGLWALTAHADALPTARRVVSLNPSLTAILVAIGARDALVGVDDYSAREVPEVAALPRVGGLYNPSLEAVLALRPDLVVLVPSVEQRDFQARLDELRIPHAVFDPVRLDDVLATIEVLGARVGRREAARARVASLRATFARAERVLAGRPPPRAVLVLQRDPLFVVGAGNFVGEILAAAHVENVGASLGAPWPRVSREWLIAAAPEWILDASGEPEPAELFWSRWPSLPAVRGGRIATLPPGLATLPGPHLDRGLVAFVRAVHGEALALAVAGDAP